jgi:magnesium transporter
MENGNSTGSFVFFSDLLGRKVYDNRGVICGKVYDLAVNANEAYPKISTCLIDITGITRYFLTCAWSNVLELTNDSIKLGVGADSMIPTKVRKENQIYLREDVLDKQIVDTQGAKLVRVNDLQLIRVNNDLFLAHVDVGIKGALRRLGFLGIINRIVGPMPGMRKKLEHDKFLAWKFVQPLSLAEPTGKIMLNINQGELKEMHPADLADIIEDLDVYKRSAFFGALDNKTAADALKEAPMDMQISLIGSVSPEKAADILEEMPPDEAADLLGDLPTDKAEHLINKMESEDAENVQELLVHPDDSAGGLMTTEYIALNKNLKVSEALDYIRKEAQEAETIYYLYVTDEVGKLAGVATLKNLIMSDPSKLISEIMNDSPQKVLVGEHLEKVAQVTAKYNLFAIPVVDGEGMLKGIITVDDVLEEVISDAWQRKSSRLYMGRRT